MTQKSVYNYKGYEIETRMGLDSRGHHWLAFIDGEPLKRQGQLVVCSGRLWAKKHAEELIDSYPVKRESAGINSKRRRASSYDN